MYGLPIETKVQKPAFLISKLAQKLGLNDTDKNYLVSDVKKMAITNAISTKTIPALAAGKVVKSITVIQCEVNRENYNRDVLCKVSAAISGQAVFIIKYAGLSSVLLNFEGKPIRSGWEQNLEFVLQGLTIDTVWENLVKAVGQIDQESGLTLKQQIEINDLREKLQKQITSIEKKARAEKQPRKKFEYAQQKKALEQELENKITEMRKAFQQEAMVYNIK